VDAYFAEHPQFERAMRASQKADVHVPVSAPAGGEQLAMQRVKGLLRWRGTAMGLAIGFSLTPLSFLVQDDRLTWSMLRDAPGTAVVYAMAAMVAWVAYAVLRRRVNLP
jgi:hypothetical protein